MIRSLALLATLSGLALVAGGCATPPASPAPTHYWESDVTSRQYHRDHSACEQASLVDADGQLDPESTSFSDYRDCMIEHGYTLRTY